MDKWQRWSQMEGDRSAMTGVEVLMGPGIWDIRPMAEFDRIRGRVSMYHAQLVLCDCGVVLDVGDSCEHLAFEAGLPARLRALVPGYRRIAWRSFSPVEVV